jgi:predicted Ser/Thr protein kinase
MPDDIHSLLRLGLEEEAPASEWLARQTPGHAHPDTPATSNPGGVWQPPTVAALQMALPQYEVTGFLARGGMGAVYQGIQRALHRHVAIKILPPEMDDRDLRFAAGFQLEAQAMARLSHPNIVAVYEAGETANGLLYFVMEHVDGTDVGQMLEREGHLPPEQAVDICIAVCDALAFAHEEGIIHRDIKPANVMVDRKGRVKVADFGLAKVLNSASQLLSGSHFRVGTPDFIAPEALLPGNSVDGRVDLYSVGVMLYQMLTGSIPRGRFLPPSAVRPHIDRRLDAIVDRALQTDLKRRYATAAEMKRDLLAAAGGAARHPAVKRLIAGKGGARALALALASAALLAAWAAWNWRLAHPAAATATATATKAAAPQAVAAPPVSAANASPPARARTWTPLRLNPHSVALNGLALTAEGVLKATHGFSLERLGTNVGIQGYLRRPADVAHSGLQVRVVGPSHVALQVGMRQAWLRPMRNFPEPRPDHEALTLRPGQGQDTPMHLRLVVIGTTAYGWVDGQPLPMLQLKDPPKWGGVNVWSQNGEFSDLQFLDLDDLSEQEAKKLAGINDD